MRYDNNQRLRGYLDRGAAGAYREHMRHPRFEIDGTAFAAALSDVRAQHPSLTDDEAQARAVFRLLTMGAPPEVAVPLPSPGYRAKAWVHRTARRALPWVKILWAIAVLALCAIAAHAEPDPPGMRAIRNAMSGWPAQIGQPNGLTIQFQNGGTVLATRPAGLVALNCSTNMTCSFSGYTLTLTAAAGGGSSGSVSGQANGVVPLGTTATSITQQSHLDDGITTSGTVTSSEPLAAPTFANTGVATGSTGFGTGALNGNTAVQNTAFGYHTLFSSPSGIGLNSAFGYRALLENTTGYENNSFGNDSLELNQTGAQNSAFGHDALNNELGNAGTAMGWYALSNMADSYDTAFGTSAGEFDSTTAFNTAGELQLFLGFLTQPLHSGDSNEIVIGSGTPLGSPLNGAGANTAVIGSAAVTDVYFGSATPASVIHAAGWALGGRLAVSGTAPTVSSGFGTGAAITASNGTAAFRVSVGTSNTGTGVIGLPTAATGWNCYATNITTKSATQASVLQTASTTASVTFQNYSDVMATHAMTDNDVLDVSCFAY